MNTSTLGGLPIEDPPPGSLEPINYFHSGTGASRPGVGAFLMRRSDYDKLVESYGAHGEVELVLKGNPAEGLTVTLKLAGFLPFSAAVGADRSFDMVKVIVTDKRCRMTTPTTKSFNVQRLGFPYVNGATASFYFATLTPATSLGVEFTWAEVMTALELEAIPDAPTWKPRNLTFDNAPLCRVADHIAGQLWIVAGYDYAASLVKFYAPGTYSDANAALLAKAKKVYTGGQEGAIALRRLPGTIRVCFRKVALASVEQAYDPFASGERHYTKSITVTEGDGTYILPVHVGGYVNVYLGGGGARPNEDECDTVATDIAARVKAMLKAPWAEWVFPGIWPFHPDGAIRSVRWVSDARGARTYLKVNAQRDCDPLEDFTNAYSPTAGPTLNEYGGRMVNVDSGSGARFIMPPPPSRVLVRFDSVLTGGRSGEYNGTILTVSHKTSIGTTDTGDSFDDDNGASTALGPCIIQVADEEGSGAAVANNRARLSSMRYGDLVGFNPGSVVGTTALPVVRVETAAAKTTGGGSTVAPTGASADSSTWSMNAGIPTTIRWKTRSFYDVTTGEWFEFYRDFLIRSDGRISSYTAETRGTIDTAVANPDGGSTGHLVKD